MNFVLDVGNTNTVLGVFENESLQYQWRIKTDRHKTEDEYGMLIKSLLDHEALNLKILMVLSFLQLCHLLCLHSTGCLVIISKSSP